MKGGRRKKKKKKKLQGAGGRKRGKRKGKGGGYSAGFSRRWSEKKASTKTILLWRGKKGKGETSVLTNVSDVMLGGKGGKYQFPRERKKGKGRDQ